MMKRIIVLIIIALSLMSTATYAATYYLNKVIPAEITITGIEADLYTDFETTIPFTGTLDFGTHVEGGTYTKVLYYRLSEVSGVNVSANLPDGASLTTLSEHHPGGSLVVGLHMRLSGFQVGTHNFTITITGE